MCKSVSNLFIRELDMQKPMASKNSSDFVVIKLCLLIY